MLDRLARVFGILRRREQWEAGLEDELANHLAARANDLIARGLTPDRARRQARLELGSTEHYREEARAASGLRVVDEIWQDLRYAGRTLRRSPAFALVAISSLALGVGANTVVFSAVNSLLLRPLPIDRPAEVYFVQPNFWPSFSHPNFRDVRDRNRSFTGMAGYAIAQAGLSGDATPERVWALLVTGNYFDLLGVKPALGRFFTAAEDRDAGGAPLVVLSHALWRRRFGGDSTIVGRAVPVNGRPYTVLGVAPRAFTGTETLLRPEVFIPMSMQAELWGYPWLEQRNIWNIFTVGRLKPGVTPEAARADLAAIATDLGREFPDANRGLTLALVRPGLFGETARRPVEAFALGVLALAILVLLAACANLASLLAARVSDRAGELALRISIGAGRFRVVRQLVTETVAVALIGGAVGWLVARWLLVRASRWQPSGVGGIIQINVEPDWRVFGAAFGAALVAGLTAALAPARLAWRVDLNAIIKGVTQARGARRWSVREGLLATQVALAALLVAACLVSVRGLRRSLELPTGIEPEGVAVVAFDRTFTPRSPEQHRVLQRRALDQARALPGVDAVAFGTPVPLTLYQSHATVYRGDAIDFGPTAAVSVNEYSVSPGFFQVLGTRLLEGRDIAWTDDEKTPPVAVVNRRFAELLLGPGNPIGQRFRTGQSSPPVEVVGVVEDGRYSSLAESRQPALFWPAFQNPFPQTMILARSTRPAATVAAEMRRMVSGLDPTVPITDVGPLTNLTDFALLPGRLAAAALTAFGVLALMLAVTGIHGMAAYTVSRRIREIGVRTALGASPGRVIREVLGRTAVVVGVGSAIGMALALVSARLVGRLLVQASPREPLILIGTAVAMAAIGLASALAPARRAISTEPLRAVRGE